MIFVQIPQRIPNNPIRQKNVPFITGVTKGGPYTDFDVMSSNFRALY